MLMVAKEDPKKPLGTIITIDHFKEIRRFEEWLYRLEYPIVPGIPNGMPYEETPESLTWYDLCIKQNVRVKIWPEDTPAYCRLVPSSCPKIKAPEKNRCQVGNSPLDFIYDRKLKDYNFRQF